MRVCETERDMESERQREREREQREGEREVRDRSSRRTWIHTPPGTQTDRTIRVVYGHFGEV